MSKTFEQPEKYSVTAMKGDSRVFIDYDAHSGGYPYWSTLSMVRTVNTLAEAVRMYNYDYLKGPGMKNGVTEVSLVKVRTVLETINIDGDETLQVLRNEALAKLTKADRDVLGV